ncbi:MAG: bacteriohemerythrin [candidate division Zixibacteria bacterium]|nr:bacteriohemerythrin [candidate division Zixibacteria bacterium]
MHITPFFIQLNGTGFRHDPAVCGTARWNRPNYEVLIFCSKTRYFNENPIPESDIKNGSHLSDKHKGETIMPLIEWKSEYDTGIESIDKQHRRLVNMINALDRSRKDNNSDRTIRNVMIAIANYTKLHFADEENLMRKLEFDELEYHQGLHNKLREQVVNILTRIGTDQHYNINNLIQFLSNWLLNHISKEDQKIGARAKSISASNNSQNEHILLNNDDFSRMLS